MSTPSFPKRTEGVAHHPIQVAVYVPSTNFEKPISSQQYKARIDETVSFLNRTFGGSTRVRGTGSWEDNGKTINEEVTIVETFAKADAYRKNHAKLKAWLKKKRTVWKQYVLTMEYENDAYFISK